MVFRVLDMNLYASLLQIYSSRDIDIYVSLFVQLEWLHFVSAQNSLANVFVTVNLYFIPISHFAIQEEHNLASC